MKTLITLLIPIAVLSCAVALADAIPLTQKERQLHDQFSSTKNQPPRSDAIAAFHSAHHLLHLDAVKWVLLNRDFELWKEVQSEKIKFKGTSLELAPLLDRLNVNRPSNDQPLVLVLNRDELSLMTEVNQPKPRRHLDGDPPSNEVLFEILAKDVQNIQTPADKRIEAAKVLLHYHAPSAAVRDSLTAITNPK